MTYDAGRSRGVWEIDVSQADRALDGMRQRLLQFEQLQQRVLSRSSSPGSSADLAGITAAQARAAQQLQRDQIAASRIATEQQRAQAVATTTAARVASEEQRRQTSAANSAALAALRQQAAQQRITAAEATSAAARQVAAQKAVAQASQQAALAEQRHATETARTAAAQDRAAIAAARRQQVESKGAQNGGLGPALPRTFAGFTPQGLNQALGAFGLATFGPQIVGQAISAGTDAAKNAIELDHTVRLTRELTGTQAAYNNVIAAAKTQQELYGGSLQENIAGIQGLVVTSRSTGAELKTLIDLSQRLAVLDPAQGAEGARIALSEIFSGDPRSLSRRYEIPLQALTKIKDTSIPVAERLVVLDQYLAKIGITSATVSGVVTEQAKTFNRLGAELGNLQTNAGAGLANFFERSAEGLGRLVGLINGNPEAIAKLRALLNGKGEISPQDVQQVATEQAQTLADRQLSPARTGDPFASEATRKQPDMLRASAQASEENAAAVAVLREQLTQLNLAGGDAQARAQQLADQWQAGAISADDFRVRVQALSDQQNAGRDIEAARVTQLNAMRDAEAKAGAELIANLQQKVEAKNKTDELSQAEATLASIGEQVRQGLITSGDGAAVLASLLQLPIDKARELLGLQLQLGNVSGAAAFSKAIPADAQRALAASKAAGEAAELQRQKVALLGTQQQQLAQAEADLATARRVYGAESVQAYEAEAKRNALRRQGLRGGSKGLSGLDRSEIALLSDYQSQLNDVNARLANGNLTAQQRNQLLLKQRELQDKINDALEKERDLQTDIALAGVKNEEAKLKEARELERLRRAEQSGKYSGSDLAAIQLRQQEILLEQQKRENELAQKRRALGETQANLGDGAQAERVASAQAAAQQAQAVVGAQQRITPPVPFPNAPPSPAGSTQVVVNLSIEVDERGQAQIKAIDPGVVLNLLSGKGGQANLSGTR